MTHDPDSEALQELACDGAGPDPGRGLPGAGALEHVTDVLTLVLDRAGEVGVARARTGHDRSLRPPGVRHCLLGDTHGVLPVHPVPVLDQERDGSADRLARPYSRQNLGHVGLDDHPATSSVAALPPP